METLSTSKVYVYGLIFILIVISLFINLGIHPLYLEGPRRALIALEMIFNNNYIVPTEFGDYYYKKPPLYNWMIVFMYKIFGNYSEFTTRLVTVLSHIGMGISLYWIGRNYVTHHFGILAALLFLVSIDIYYYFSVLAEIDIFYSLITLLSFFTLFHFYQTKQYLLLFVITYFLGALGTLTKGFPSMVFLGISLPVFFVYNKDFKRLFSLHHILGVVVYIVVVGGYFYMYSRYNSLTGYFHDLWSQSSERTLIEKSIMSLINHLIAFPLETLKNILPASLFLIFMIKKGAFSEIRKNKLIEFCFYMFSTNCIVYWLSPGSRARYVYMLYPLLILILLYFYLINEDEKRKRVFEIVVGSVIILAFLLSISVPFIPHFNGLDGLNILAVISACLLLVVFIVYFKKAEYRLISLILTLVVLRFVFNFTVLPSRAKPDQQAQIEKNDAERMAAIVKEARVDVLAGSPLSHTTVFYLERDLEKVVGFKSEKNLNDFFIVPAGQSIPDSEYKVYYEFISANEKRHLIKFLK